MIYESFEFTECNLYITPWDVNIAIEHGHRKNWICPLNMVIFHGDASLPEGLGFIIQCFDIRIINSSLNHH